MQRYNSQCNAQIRLLKRSHYTWEYITGAQQNSSAREEESEEERNKERGVVYGPGRRAHLLVNVSSVDCRHVIV